MVRWFRVISILSATLIIQACAPKSQTDCGFVQNVYGERISWKGNIPVEMYLHSSVPDELIPAIEAAADSWKSSSGRPLIRIHRQKIYNLSEQPARDGRNVIYFLNSWEADRFNEQGRTSVYWIGDQIKEADIRINAKNFSFSWSKTGMTAMSAANKTHVEIESLMLHEMGHVLGMKHNDGDPSVMATYLASAETRTSLTVMDANSLQCEY